MINHMKQGLQFIKDLMATALLAILFVCFILSHHRVPTGSMISTINEDDHVLVTRLPYYYRNPQYGEIVTFKRPSGEDWVKRVIGLPGDVIDIIDGKVYRNGEQLDESAYVPEWVSSTPAEFAYFEERCIPAQQFPYTVAEDAYFLMGDNREESGDCRYLGAIKQEDIYGKVIFRIYPFDQMGRLQ